MRYGPTRQNLDRHPNYILAACIASGTYPAQPASSADRVPGDAQHCRTEMPVSSSRKQVWHMSFRLSHGASGAIRRFAGWVARGSVGHPMLDGIEYWDELKDSPSQMEICLAILSSPMSSNLTTTESPLTRNTPSSAPPPGSTDSARANSLPERPTLSCGNASPTDASFRSPPNGLSSSAPHSHDPIRDVRDHPCACPLLRLPRTRFQLKPRC
jgi:hypothetical protein